MAAFDLRRTGRLEEAERAYRNVLDRMRAVVGSDHKGQVIDTLWDLASLLRDRRRYAEAANIGLRLVEACKHIPPADRPETLAAMMWTAETRRREGDLEGAARLLGEVRLQAMKSGKPDLGVETIAACRLLLTTGSDIERSVRTCLERVDGLPRDIRPGLAQTLLFDLAAASAASGRMETAFETLRRMLERGTVPDGIRGFLNEPDGAPLRGDPRVEALLADKERRGRTASNQ